MRRLREYANLDAFVLIILLAFPVLYFGLCFLDVAEKRLGNASRIETIIAKSLK